jgi:putative transposase
MTSLPYLIPDFEWIVIQEKLPTEMYTGKGSLGGRPHADLRVVLSGLIYWIRTGCQWELIPPGYGSKTTLSKYKKKWVLADLCSQLFKSILEKYDDEVGIDWSFQSIDGSIKRAPGCSDEAGKNPTDRARPGTKHMILTDKKGIPLAVNIIPANQSDMTQMENTFTNFYIERPDPKEVPQHLCADKGFDSVDNRDIAMEWGYKTHIRPKGEGWIPIRKYSAKRWVVERTHSWLNQFRGIHTRRIKNSKIYEAMTLLACAILILSKLA